MRRRLGLLLLAIFLLAACSPAVSPDNPALPDRQLEISSELAQKVETQLTQQLLEDPSGRFALTLSESEVTSYLLYRLERDLRGSPIRDLKIWFEDGQVVAFGKLVNVAPITVEFLAVVSLNFEEGQLRLDFNEVYIGDFALPRFALNFLSQTATETIAETEFKLRITDLEIRQGSLTLRGQLSW